MTRCIQIYNTLLPEAMGDLVNNLMALKSVQFNQENSELFIAAVFRKDFVKFLLLFLNEAYDRKPIQY